ncbi:hypothetical protein PANN_23200 [Pseudomonas aeruginosa C-NN2]|nr:hypothetical protein PANN_23200 [Pseudomonas aeruginosa C-NN2]
MGSDMKFSLQWVMNMVVCGGQVDMLGPAGIGRLAAAVTAWPALKRTIRSRPRIYANVANSCALSLAWARSAERPPESRSNLAADTIEGPLPFPCP